jgi:alpha-beta hydrolase superfamily lysophospholipase
VEIEVDFTADRFKLQGTLHLPPAPSPPVVIGCHGLLSDRTSPKQLALAQACNRRGLAFFRFDHRGCGDSEGRLEEHTTLDSRCSDLRHAIGHLAGRAELGKRIGLFGSSLGGAVCLRVAAHVDIACLVTFAAPVRSRPLTMVDLRAAGDPARARMAAVLRQDYDLGAELGRLRNIMVVHGEADDVVPVAHAHEIFERAGPPKQLVIQPRGDHLMRDPRHQEAFLREASLWLSTYLG